MIVLTCELLGVTGDEEVSVDQSAANATVPGSSTSETLPQVNIPVQDHALPSLLVNLKSGIKCLAPWSKDYK